MEQHDVKAMLDERVRLFETIFMVADALGFSVYKSRQEHHGDAEYHLPSGEDMVYAIKKMTSSEVRCVAALGTEDCVLSAPKAESFAKGWRTVAKDWWCPNCMERYGFIPDVPQPQD